ncbi:MAG TPA: hypothetical protein VIL52_04105 [Bacteroidota bacterium]
MLTKNTSRVKRQFHKLIDTIENNELLTRLYEALSNSSRPESKLWKSLSKQEREEVLYAFEESEYNANVVSHGVVREKHKKRLTK